MPKSITNRATYCYLALNALAMGDCGAVEYAQQSHFNVLASFGSSKADRIRGI